MRIVLTGFFGAGNLGDEAILASEIRGFSHHSPGCSFAVASFSPEFHRALGLEAFHARDNAALTDAISRADLLVVGGGGLWQDYWGWNPGDLFAPEPSNIAFYARGPLAASALGVPFVLFANGIGPLKDPLTRKTIGSLAELAESVSVRDEESSELLRLCGYQGGIVGVADPAFAIKPDASGVIPRTRRLRIGVAPRLWVHGPAPESFLEMLGQALALVCERQETELIFLPFQRSNSAVAEDDRTAIVQVRQALRDSQADIFAVEPETPEAAAGWLGTCDVVLTMRLHGSVLAAVGGVPSVAVAIDPKLTSNARVLLSSDLVVDPSSCTPESIEASVFRALNSRESRVGGLNRTVDQAIKLLDVAFETAITAAKTRRQGAGDASAEKLLTQF
ncbi:MAG TPA: polysaccharide pyruvyl transferase family protein, partial [Blastocatellia bacterium]|nr:polysaccharide pyruvyl transferase family protein [Blastocatellia bacterium]